MMSSQFRRLLPGTAFLVALYGLVLVVKPALAAPADMTWETKRTTVPEDVEELKALQERVQKVVEKCTPCTVGIRIGFGAGSGVIVSEDGLVLTAAHVLYGEPSKLGKLPVYRPGQECRIVLPDGKDVKAKTLGVNSDADSGMLQIIDKAPTKDGKWPFCPVGKSVDLKKGQWLVSLGHPGGPKTGRPPVARLGRVEANGKEVRTNCTLVGGDSGGPLFDLDGNIVGIHSRIGLTLAQNIHVPTEQFQKQWDKLVAGEVFGEVAEKKETAKGAVAVGISFPEEEDEDAYLVEVSDGGPAQKAGLEVGDTITKINGQTIKSVKQFRELIQLHKPGDVVKLTVRRETKILVLSITLEKKEEKKK